MSTAGALLLLPRHWSARQEPLLNALAWSPLHLVMSRVTLRSLLVLFPFRWSPTPTAWRPMEKQATGSLASLCIPRPCLHYRGPVVMLLLILIGARPWKMNMQLFRTTTLGISSPALPRLTLLLENGFSSTSSMQMAHWRDTRLVGYFGDSLNASVLTMMKPSARLLSQPLFAQSSWWHTLGIGRFINLM